ncbi:hypothetical protein MAR_ORF380 [Marseillevirus marseillevirus]|uniref:Uncharacterized protein n=1 Tax=Marseillevirus marseillevirus TaxID=694581 RepID=D2XB16_GBMV|nr:hypothetical protein MAR_ORF380 [Marseillevirus marseillevirus]YP_009094840.1 hypothetical protein MEL_339 [Melbournevirus]ADB04143.1 hypothetical protein MAR_ORF380 [Marseillevirus marseillevirus]AIT54952.1 hypothetical protein MEL_339 [Melbournevirus]
MKIAKIRLKLWLYDRAFSFQLFSEKSLSQMKRQERALARKTGLLRLLSAYAPEERGKGSEYWLSVYQHVPRPKKLMDLCIQKIYSLETLKSMWLLWLSKRRDVPREISNFPSPRKGQDALGVLLSTTPGFLFAADVCLCVNNETHCKLMVYRTIQRLSEILANNKRRMDETAVLSDDPDLETSCFSVQGEKVPEEECLEMTHQKGEIILNTFWCIVRAFNHKSKVRIYGISPEEESWICFFDTK